MVQDPRTRLLEATVDYVETHGIAELSLRQLADAIGTSHRMLLYHFGSKDELLAAVVEAMEARERAIYAQLAIEANASAARVLLEQWDGLSKPERAAQETLFFEVYVQALRGHAHAAPLLPAIVTDWIDAAVDAGADPTLARLGLAVVRGLLLDLLATGDEQGVRSAVELFAQTIDRAQPSGR